MVTTATENTDYTKLAMSCYITHNSSSGKPQQLELISMFDKVTLAILDIGGVLKQRISGFEH